MRVTLQAAAVDKFPLYHLDGSTLTLSQADRDSLNRHAAMAEQQNKVRWWKKGTWQPFGRFWSAKWSFGNG
jgi:hypothetical protein